MKGLVSYTAHTLLSIVGRQVVAVVYNAMSQITYQSAMVLDDDLTTGERLMYLMDEYTELLADGKADEPDFISITFGTDRNSIALTGCTYNEPVGN